MEHEDTEDMINDCINRVYKLSEWESKFIMDMLQWLEEYGDLTDKQYEQLVKIWERVT